MWRFPAGGLPDPVTPVQLDASAPTA